MITEFKKIIALKLLAYSLFIMPDCNFKIKLAELINTEMLNGMD